MGTSRTSIHIATYAGASARRASPSARRRSRRRTTGGGRWDGPPVLAPVRFAITVSRSWVDRGRCRSLSVGIAGAVAAMRLRTPRQVTEGRPRSSPGRFRAAVSWYCSGYRSRPSAWWTNWPHCALAWTVSSTHCSPLNMCSKCSVVPCLTALHALASIGSPIALPRLRPKPVNSPHPENGQRLAGNVGHSEVGFLRPQALAFSPIHVAHPHAGGCGDRRRAAGAGIGGRHRLRDDSYFSRLKSGDTQGAWGSATAITTKSGGCCSGSWIVFGRLSQMATAFCQFCKRR